MAGRPQASSYAREQGVSSVPTVSLGTAVFAIGERNRCVAEERAEHLIMGCYLSLNKPGGIVAPALPIGTQVVALSAAWQGDR